MHANVDKQMNGHDCGVYAIAFATSLCYGQDVISTHYDTQKILPFTSAYEEKSRKLMNEEAILPLQRTRVSTYDTR